MSAQNCIGVGLGSFVEQKQVGFIDRLNAQGDSSLFLQTKSDRSRTYRVRLIITASLDMSW